LGALLSAVIVEAVLRLLLFTSVQSKVPHQPKWSSN
jgi:hypothetical protein